MVSVSRTDQSNVKRSLTKKAEKDFVKTISDEVGVFVAVIITVLDERQHESVSERV